MANMAPIAVKDEDEEAADEEDNVDDEDDEITRIREAKGKKKKGGGSKAVTENSGIEFTNQNNVYMVSAGRVLDFLYFVLKLLPYYLYS